VGERLESITTVASLFLSRNDTKDEMQLPGHSPRRGKIALASAPVAYQS
jgi:hypothetical protein